MESSMIATNFYCPKCGALLYFDRPYRNIDKGVLSCLARHCNFVRVVDRGEDILLEYGPRFKVVFNWKAVGLA